MSNDLDDLDAALRGAMAALEGEAPPGYFEALPARTLARLDDPAIGELPDDPGRRGIRDLAGESRARPRRAAQGERPPADDDDEVFSSQIMAAVELPEPDEAPEPAKPVASVAGPRLGVRSASSMIAVLPVPPGEPGEPAMAATASRPASAAPTPSSRASAGPVEAPGSAAASMPSAELPGRRRSRRVRAAIVGVSGIGLAAAVVVIYLVSVRSAPPTAASRGRAATASAPGAAELSAGGGSSMTSVAVGSATSAEQIAPAGGMASGSAPTAPAIAVGAGPSAGSDLASGAPPEPVGKLAVPVIKRPGNAKAPSKSGGGKLQVEVPAGTAGNGAAAAGSGAATGADRPGEDAQQSPDKPGPSVKKLKSNKPRPDRTSLSSDEFERAMTAVAGKARACAAGTSGTASLRLTIAPSGRIAQVTVTGSLAGTPVGACVERAVRTATFPPWDGAPQSFDYSYPLSD